jgi:hypothetical protein
MIHKHIFSENKKTISPFYSLFKNIDISKPDFFDKIKYYFSIIWLVQISISLLYCIQTRRFSPVPPNESSSIFISQFHAYLFAQSILYFVEILFSNIFFFRFERFAHHIFIIRRLATLVKMQILF